MVHLALPDDLAARVHPIEQHVYWETKGKTLYGHVILKYVTSGTRSEYCKFINVSTNPCCELVRIKQVIHAIISEWDPFIVCKVYFHSLAIIMLTNPDCVFFFLSERSKTFKTVNGIVHHRLPVGVSFLCVT